MYQFRRRSTSYHLIAIILLIASFTSCGGGSGSSGSTGSTGGSGSNGGSGGTTFQARPFPGDYFMRLPNQGNDGTPAAVAYDPVLKEMFVTNPGNNTVEVYSTADGHRVGGVSVPGPVGLSFSPDYSELAVGTITAYFYLVDPVALRVRSQIVIPSALMSTNAQTGVSQPGVVGSFPVAPFIMNDGHIFIGMGGSGESGANARLGVVHLVSYDPGTGTFALSDPPDGPGGTPSRSLDGKYLVVQTYGQMGPEFWVFSTATQNYVGPATTTGPLAGSIAVNFDGSQFASLLAVSGGTQVTFWNKNLTQGPQYTSSGEIGSYLNSAVYSRDGKSLYLLDSNPFRLLALNTQTATPAGYLGVSVGSLLGGTFISDIDDNYHLLGATTGGAFVVNVSQMQSTSPTAIAQFFGSPTTEANPNVGPLSGGTQVQFIPTSIGSGSADGIDASMQAYFGSVPATNDVVAPYPASSDLRNFLTATAPAVTTPGPVTVVLTNANNDVVFLPDAYTYGPKILHLGPNAVSAKGGDQITLTAYGLGFFDAASIQVTIGGARTVVTGLNSYSSNYPEQTVMFTAPPGAPGWADVTVTTPNGTDTLKRGVQYLAVADQIQSPPYSFAVYDSSRDRFYLTGSGNSVAVFDPGTQTLLQPLQSSAVSSGAVLQSEALTPDNSKLLVSDPADGTVVVFDLASGSSSGINVLLPSDPLPNPAITVSMFITASSGNRAFVSLSPCFTNPVREIDLTNSTVQPRPDAVSSCSAYPQSGASTADGSLIVFSNGVQPFGTLPYLWKYDAAADAFGTPVSIQNIQWQYGEAAVSGDGNVISFQSSTLDRNLLPLVPVPIGSYHTRLNNTGSLLYYSNNPVNLADTRNGRTLLSLPPGTPLAIDPSGRKVLLANPPAGIAYYELSVIPLAVGSVSPTSVSAGSTITLHGSGFVSGTTVTISGQRATCTLGDAETLSCTVPNLKSGAAPIALANPDGQTYAFENAFTVQ